MLNSWSYLFLILLFFSFHALSRHANQVTEAFASRDDLLRGNGEGFQDFVITRLRSVYTDELNNFNDQELSDAITNVVAIEDAEVKEHIDSLNEEFDTVSGTIQEYESKIEELKNNNNSTEERSAFESLDDDSVLDSQLRELNNEIYNLTNRQLELTTEIRAHNEIREIYRHFDNYRHNIHEGLSRTWRSMDETLADLWSPEGVTDVLDLLNSPYSAVFIFGAVITAKTNSESASSLKDWTLDVVSAMSLFEESIRERTLNFVIQKFKALKETNFKELLSSFWKKSCEWMGEELQKKLKEIKSAPLKHVFYTFASGMFYGILKQSGRTNRWAFTGAHLSKTYIVTSSKFFAYNVSLRIWIKSPVDSVADLARIYFSAENALDDLRLRVLEFRPDWHPGLFRTIELLNEEIYTQIYEIWKNLLSEDERTNFLNSTVSRDLWDRIQNDLEKEKKEKEKKEESSESDSPKSGKGEGGETFPSANPEEEKKRDESEKDELKKEQINTNNILSRYSYQWVDERLGNAFNTTQNQISQQVRGFSSLDDSPEAGEWWANTNANANSSNPREDIIFEDDSDSAKPKKKSADPQKTEKIENSASAGNAFYSTNTTPNKDFNSKKNEPTEMIDTSSNLERFAKKSDTSALSRQSARSYVEEKIEKAESEAREIYSEIIEANQADMEEASQTLFDTLENYIKDCVSSFEEGAGNMCSFMEYFSSAQHHK